MTLTQFLRIVEIRTKIISMGTFASGTLFALYAEGRLSLPILFLMAFATLFVDMGTTGFNSYFDYRNGTDTKEANCEDDKVLVYQGVSPLLALLVSLLLFASAGVLGLVLAYMTSWKLLVVGGICMLVGFAYTGGPFPISRTPFGELFAGFFLGTTLFLISFFVQTGTVTREALLASIPSLILIGMILSVNNSCDRMSDALAGRKTLTIILGKWGTTFLLGFEAVLILASFVMLFVRGIYPLILLVALVPFVMVGSLEFRAMVLRGFSNQTKQQNMGSIGRVYLVFSLCFSLGLLVAHLLN
ncbi:MAG TPA: prenyltransferase [Spirochaetales bacterium]|jgi:1,4-dihydroxy-2-naphthoate octaprenyltransferase|nr:prenyltransferase [Spirochaetales bacterium]